MERMNFPSQHTNNSNTDLLTRKLVFEGCITFPRSVTLPVKVSAGRVTVREKVMHRCLRAYCHGLERNFLSNDSFIERD